MRGQFVIIRHNAVEQPPSCTGCAEMLVAKPKRPRIGSGPEEAREEAGVGQRFDLPFHAFLLIGVPPAAAELQLAGVPPWKFPIIVANVKLSIGLLL